MNSEFNRILTVDFAWRIYQGLEVKGWFDPLLDSIPAYGQILTSPGKSTAVASCQFQLTSDWHKRPPRVVCKEPWLKVDIDWHVFKDRSLCLELPENWESIVHQTAEEYSWWDAAHLAAAWTLRNTALLLHRHKIAYRENLAAWPKEWDEWAHDAAGLKEYQDLKSRRAA